MIDPIVAFQARCEARAYIWSKSQMDIHDAVDVLQIDAMRTGLVLLLGQDEVQKLISREFARLRGFRC